MDINLLIGLIVSAVIGIPALVFSETIKNVIKNFSSNLSKQQTTVIFILLLIIAISAPVLIGFLVSPTNTDIDPNNQDSTAIDNKNDWVELGKDVIKVGTQFYYTQKKKDSIRMANREQFWVYQIGTPKKNPDELWESLKALTDIQNLYVFKESRKSYYIVKDDGYTKDVLNDSLVRFKSRIDSTGNRLKIIDLMTFCSKRKKIKEGDKIKEKKGGLEVRCYVCDK
jgi:hypothetical protein